MTAKILIVEDQADIRRLIRWALQDSGHTLHEAANGALALQIATALRPDLMLLDVEMPGELSGLDVCRRIREDAALADTLLVMLSANASQADRDRAAAAGADSFLAKPFNPGQLLQLLGGLLERRGAG